MHPQIDRHPQIADAPRRNVDTHFSGSRNFRALSPDDKKELRARWFQVVHNSVPHLSSVRRLVEVFQKPSRCGIECAIKTPHVFDRFHHPQIVVDFSYVVKDIAFQTFAAARCSNIPMTESMTLSSRDPHLGNA